MEERITQLNQWGCDTESALKRLCGDKEFYFECLVELHNDPLFGELCRAIESKDAVEAFKISHTLKGVLSNYGVTPLYKKTVEIVEPLRNGGFDKSVIEKTNELMRLNDRLGEIIGE